MDENAPPPSYTQPPAAAPSAAPPPPPPLTPPPVIVAPSSTPPRRRGRGWMVFALILLVLLGCSMLVNVGHLLTGLGPMKVGRMNTVGPRLEEVNTEDNGDRKSVVEGKGVEL